MDVKNCERCSLPISLALPLRPKRRFCSEDCRWRFYHAKHKVRLREYNRQWMQDNPDKVAASLSKHRDKRLASLKAWKARNPQRVKELQKLSAQRCRAQARIRRERWIEKYPERMKESRKKWRSNNPDKHAADVRSRQLAKSHAEPTWLSKAQKKQMVAFYKEAARLTKEKGIPHEVDHIIPIRGKQVCGLHVPWNLQVLTCHENRRKSAKFA